MGIHVLRDIAKCAKNGHIKISIDAKGKPGTGKGSGIGDKNIFCLLQGLAVPTPPGNGDGSPVFERFIIAKINIVIVLKLWMQNDIQQAAELIDDDFRYTGHGSRIQYVITNYPQVTCILFRDQNRPVR